jgi:hypothetical protein
MSEGDYEKQLYEASVLGELIEKAARDIKEDIKGLVETAVQREKDLISKMRSDIKLQIEKLENVRNIDF